MVRLHTSWTLNVVSQLWRKSFNIRSSGTMDTSLSRLVLRVSATQLGQTEVDMRYIGPLVPQELRHPQAGVEGTDTAVQQLPPGPGGVVVAQTIMGHGPGGVFVLNLGPYLIDILLELGDGVMGLHNLRHKQLVAPGRDSQEFLELNADAVIDGHCADLSSLALDGDGVFPESLFRLALSKRAQSFLKRHPMPF